MLAEAAGRRRLPPRFPPRPPSRRVPGRTCRWNRIERNRRRSSRGPGRDREAEGRSGEADGGSTAIRQQCDARCLQVGARRVRCGGRRRQATSPIARSTSMEPYRKFARSRPTSLSLPPTIALPQEPRCDPYEPGEPSATRGPDCRLTIRAIATTARLASVSSTSAGSALSPTLRAVNVVSLMGARKCACEFLYSASSLYVRHSSPDSHPSSCAFSSTARKGASFAGSHPAA